MELQKIFIDGETENSVKARIKNIEHMERLHEDLKRNLRSDEL